MITTTDVFLSFILVSGQECRMMSLIKRRVASCCEGELSLDLTTETDMNGVELASRVGNGDGLASDALCEEAVGLIGKEAEVL